MSLPTRKITFLLLAFVLASHAAQAGTISVGWDPVDDPELDGYTVYYGTTQGDLTEAMDVGLATEATLSGLSDCTTWYIAVKSRDAAGNESATYSNEISGWPRPVVGATDPAAGEQGGTLSVTISGSNFRAGADVQFGNAGITINSVDIVSCSEISANITISPTASLGAVNVDVTNPDDSFGSGSGVFSIVPAPAPTVVSTSPVDGATNVSVGVEPSISFSEVMLASSITSSTVRLLDASGSPVAQAPGSPALSADGLTATIDPLADLDTDQVYKIRAVGGDSGVLSAVGVAMSETYTQATGFRTEADGTGPEITGVRSDPTEPTRVVIRWDTDEDADGQVFYRKAGDSEYQQTGVDPTMATAHAMTLEGLNPSTTYEFHVRSSDVVGNASVSSPDETFTTTANGYRYIRVEAEAGDLSSPARSRSGSGAFGASYVDTPSGSSGAADDPAGTAVFGFNLPADATWYLWVRVYAPDSSSTEWFESIDSAPRQPIAASETGAWQWVAGRSYDLPAGLHSLELGGKDSEARADRILLTDDPTFVPTEQAVGDVVPTAEVGDLQAVPSDKKVTLAWTNPSDGDFAKTVVRFRVDGRFPTSPDDGFAVVENPGDPGSPGGHVHEDLVNDTTYFYTAFTVDEAGNVSVGAQIQATPLDNVPPDPVRNLRRIDVRN